MADPEAILTALPRVAELTLARAEIDAQLRSGLAVDAQVVEVDADRRLQPELFTHHQVDPGIRFAHAGLAAFDHVFEPGEDLFVGVFGVAVAGHAVNDLGDQLADHAELFLAEPAGRPGGRAEPDA